MRLRTQLTLTVTALVALVVALAGLVIVVRIDHRDRADLDRVLTARAEQVRAAAQKNGSLPTDGTYAIRLIQGGEMLKQVGSSAGFPLPAKDGYSTVSSGDDEWRSLAETLPTGAQLQILMSLDDLSEQHTDNVLVVDLLVLLAAVLSAAGVWFATGLVLRPFQRLLTAARDLDPGDPAQQLPEVKSPREVAELTATLNDLLARARSQSPAAPASTSSFSQGSFVGARDESPALAAPSAVAAPTVEMRSVEPKGGRKPDSPTSPSRDGHGRSSESSLGGNGVSSESSLGGDDRSSESSLGGHGRSSEPSLGVPESPTGPSAGPGPVATPTPPAAVTPLADSGAGTPAAPGTSDTDPSAPVAYQPVPTGTPAVAASPAVAELRPSLADLGAQLDQLLDNPDMPATQRHLILAVMADDHRRMTALLDGDA